MDLDLLGGVGLKTWEKVGSDRKLVESQGGNNWYFDHGKADGDGKGRWIPETTESGVLLLTGYMGEEDTGDPEMISGVGGMVVTPPTRKRRIFLVLEKVCSTWNISSLNM